MTMPPIVAEAALELIKSHLAGWTDQEIARDMDLDPHLFTLEERMASRPGLPARVACAPRGKLAFRRSGSWPASNSPKKPHANFACRFPKRPANPARRQTKRHAKFACRSTCIRRLNLPMGWEEEIVKNQVERAKKGDKAAIAFVFDQVLGGNELRGATFVQNVFHGAESPAKPVKAKPGSQEKIDAMSRRIASRNGAFHPTDGEDVDLS